MRTLRSVFLAGLAALAASATVVSGAAGAPVFLHEGGPVTKGAVKLSTGPLFIEVLRGGVEVSCRSASGSGTIAESAEQHQISGLSLRLRSCQARNNLNGMTCKLSGKGKGGALITARLNASLVTVGFPETFTEVGLMLAPASKARPLITFDASKPGCLPAGKRRARSVSVSGAVIGEVDDIGDESRGNDVIFETETTGYLETTQRIQRLFGGLQQVLSAYGVEAPLQTFLALRFAQPVSIAQQ
jgi:hypothetical protein